MLYGNAVSKEDSPTYTKNAIAALRSDCLDVSKKFKFPPENAYLFENYALLGWVCGRSAEETDSVVKQYVPDFEYKIIGKLFDKEVDNAINL